MRRPKLIPPGGNIHAGVGNWLGRLGRKAVITGWLLIAAGDVRAADADLPPPNLADLSLEDLVNLKVTSVSKKEEKLNDAAAAIFVLSNDDLRRSGATTVADALRLAPGLQVASIDAGNWAISARGFNSQFANKLLVMIDGRTVYAPLFSGVYWDARQVFLDDVDRIEVIRGPGATVWGANAVNGVINILSKSARDTQGGLIYAGGGDVHLAQGGARYGGQIDSNTFYRVYGAYQLNDDYRTTSGRSAHDGWDLEKSGFRIDRYVGDDSGHLTWQGDVYAGNLADHTGDQNGFNMLGRWTQRISERSNYEVQSYLDHTFRNDSFAHATVDTADLSWQHTFGLGERNDVIWGLGYRFTDSRATKANSPLITIIDKNIPLNLFSAFVQDEFKIIPDRLLFTLGTKVEHNDFTGFEVEPSARLMFKPTENQTVWAAVSRSVRTPSEVESKNFIQFVAGPPVIGPGGGLYVPTLLSDPRVKSEVLLAYELGYRIQPTHRISLDVATYYNDYRHLVSRLPEDFIPGTPTGILEIEPFNSQRAQSYGGEAVLTVAVTASWRLSASYSLLQLHVQGEPASDARAFELNAPTHQAVLRSGYDFTRRASLDADLRYVDQVVGAGAYVTADIRVSFRPVPSLELSLVGQNLLESQHPEQASQVSAPTVEVPRGFYGTVKWRF